MDNETGPYTTVQPGDLLTASLFNQVQTEIRQDIQTQIDNAIGQVDEVPLANDSEKLGGLTLDELTTSIVQQAIAAITGSNGSYQRIFRRLVVGEERRIDHGLGAFPMTDIYQLDYFPAFCAGGDEDEADRIRPVNFYLYHLNERRIRLPHKEAAKALMIEIEEADTPPARLKLADLLTLYNVSYTPATDLEELETDFWEAFFQAQGNDEFDPAQYCHSPWFEKCCGESRSVQELQDRGDWDRIYLKFRPRKTINLMASHLVISDIKKKSASEPDEKLVAHLHNHSAPSQLQVVQYDFNTLGIKLLHKPVHSQEAMEGWLQGTRKVCGSVPSEFLEELNVMVILKV